MPGRNGSKGKAGAPEKPEVEKPEVQGEGDYVSARRYNDRTAAFVRRMEEGEEVPQQPAASPAELARAEEQALARSKGRAQDRKDAGVMRENVAQTEKKRPSKR